MENKIWYCKIGGATGLPHGADYPMRQAVRKAYMQICGEEPDFIFSGWDARLTAQERVAIEDQRNNKPPWAEQYAKERSEIDPDVLQSRLNRATVAPRPETDVLAQRAWDRLYAHGFVKPPEGN